MVGHIVEMWKNTVEVQKHFNDLELRIRNFAITVLIGVFTISAFAMEKGLHVDFGTARVPLATLLLLCGLLAWMAFWSMDRFWYHELLLAAVRHGHAIEQALSCEFPEICLASYISKEMPAIKTHKNLNKFYGIVWAVLVAAVVLTWVSAS